MTRVDQLWGQNPMVCEMAMQLNALLSIQKGVHWLQWSNGMHQVAHIR